MVGIFFRATSIVGVEIILAIETSVPEASVALWADGKWLFKEGFISDRHHNSLVFDSLAKALDVLQGRELAAVVVGTGPGSYSGTRIGIAAAQGVAIARGCPAIGVGSLAATPVAREAHGANGSLAIGDARRGLFYISSILDTGEAAEAELMDADAFAARLQEAPDKALFTLDDPGQLGLDAEMETRVIRTRPEARLLVDVWQGLDDSRKQALASLPLAPSYLRPPFTSKAKSRHPLIQPPA